MVKQACAAHRQDQVAGEEAVFDFLDGLIESLLPRGCSLLMLGFWVIALLGLFALKLWWT